MKNYPDNTVKDLVGTSREIIPVAVDFDESAEGLRISLLVVASMLIKVVVFFSFIDKSSIYSNGRCRQT